jgi:hypothetical protein
MRLQGAVEARNRDYANIVRSLNFVSKGWYDTQVLADEDAEIRRKVHRICQYGYCLCQYGYCRACTHTQRQSSIDLFGLQCDLPESKRFSVC